MKVRGSTRIPKAQEMVKNLFGKEKQIFHIDSIYRENFLTVLQPTRIKPNYLFVRVTLQVVPVNKLGIEKLKPFSPSEAKY